MINNNSDEMKKELEIEIESSQGGCGGCGSHDHSGGGCGTHSHGASGGCGCGSHNAQQPADAFKPVVEEKIKTVQEKKMYEYVCYCDKVSKSKIITAIMTGAKTLEAVKEATGAISNPNCGEKNPAKKSCKDDILELIKMYG